MFGDLGFVCSFAGRSFPIDSLLNSTIVSSPSCCFLIPTVKYGLSYYLAYCISYRVASLSGSVEGKCIWRGEHRDGTGTCHTGRAIAAVPMSRARRSSRVKARVVRLTTCLPSRFGSYDFDLDEDLGPDELWDDQQHRRRAHLTEIARANFRVSYNIVRSRQILRDLDDISNAHTGLSQDADNMLPREFGLAGNVFGETISIYRKAGRTRSHQPAQIRLSLDGIAIAADLARNTDIVNRVRHSTCSFSALTECRAAAGGRT